MTKSPTSFRLTNETLERLGKIAAKEERSQAQIIERLIKREAERLSIRATKKEKK